MSLIVYRRRRSLIIEWPSTCEFDEFGYSGMKSIVVINDNTYRMMTTPLSANSLVLRVALPDYFTTSYYGLVVTVHLCHALKDNAGWKTVKSLTTCEVPFRCEHSAWQSDREHGPSGTN